MEEYCGRKIRLWEEKVCGKKLVGVKKYEENIGGILGEEYSERKRRFWEVKKPRGKYWMNIVGGKKIAKRNKVFGTKIAGEKKNYLEIGE